MTSVCCETLLRLCNNNSKLSGCQTASLLAVLAFTFGLILAGPAKTQAALLQELLGTEWLLEDLGGHGDIAEVQPTLIFLERGKVSGSGSCNRFFASVESAGDFVRFGAIAATRMQCAESVSAQEQRYFAALGAATRMSIDGSYLFLHSSPLEKPLRFKRR